MFAELLYMWIAYFIAVGLLYKYALDPIKNLLRVGVNEIIDEFEMLNDEVQQMEKICRDMKLQYERVKSQNVLHNNHLIRQMKEHRKRLEKQHEQILERFRNEMEHIHVTKVEEKILNEMKMTIVQELKLVMLDDLKATEDNLHHLLLVDKYHNLMKKNEVRE